MKGKIVRIKCYEYENFRKLEKELFDDVQFWQDEKSCEVEVQYSSITKNIYGYHTAMLIARDWVK